MPNNWFYKTKLTINDLLHRHKDWKSLRLRRLVLQELRLQELKHQKLHLLLRQYLYRLHRSVFWSLFPDDLHLLQPIDPKHLC